MATRRDFLKKAGVGSALMAIGGALPGFSASSYNRIIGANDRINMAIVGINDRGHALSQAFARLNTYCEVAALCDVDKRAIEKSTEAVKKIQTRTPKSEKDIRKMLEDRQIDAVAIATPDHWHAPAALLALQAGKHVYLEKPVSYCPREGEMLIEAVAKYGKVLQVGTQRRSSRVAREAVQQLHEGVIGKVHFGKSWYANNRQSIGTGKVVPVPDGLDWDLWQGPAPRTVYKDNIVHYNWHWFWRWGTAETLNNGTHTVDVMCWAMNVKFPTKVCSTGGRYYFNDDWETPDTQIVTMEFGNDVSMMWEGYSCSGKNMEGNSVGTVFHGDKGSLLLTGGNNYQIFDKNNNIIKDSRNEPAISQPESVNPVTGASIPTATGDAVHLINFFDAIQKGEPLHAPIEGGHKATLLMQLGNISFRTGRSLNINPANGHIINDIEAQGYWTRSYEPGWEPKV
jgi:predicted dehydrogenase